MSAHTAVAAAGSVTDLLGDYLSWVDDLDMTPQGKRLRRLAAERFVAAYSDLDNWMKRPTPARVADLDEPEGGRFSLGVSASGAWHRISTCWPP